MRAHVEAEARVEDDGRRVYLQPDEFAAPPAPFRTGEAGLVWVSGGGDREYQRTLSKLTFLLGSASRAGRAVRVRI